MEKESLRCSSRIHIKVQYIIGVFHTVVNRLDLIREINNHLYEKLLLSVFIWFVLISALWQGVLYNFY